MKDVFGKRIRVGDIVLFSPFWGKRPRLAVVELLGHRKGLIGIKYPTSWLVFREVWHSVPRKPEHVIVVPSNQVEQWKDSSAEDNSATVAKLLKESKQLKEKRRGGHVG